MFPIRKQQSEEVFFINFRAVTQFRARLIRQKDDHDDRHLIKYCSVFLRDRVCRVNSLNLSARCEKKRDIWLVQVSSILQASGKNGCLEPGSFSVLYNRVKWIGRGKTGNDKRFLPRSSNNLLSDRNSRIFTRYR